MSELPEDWFEQHDGQRLVLSVEKVKKLYGFAKVVLDTFEKDETQGYRSRDRQFAIELLRPVIRS